MRAAISGGSKCRRWGWPNGGCGTMTVGPGRSCCGCRPSTSLLGGRANRAIEPTLIAVLPGGGNIRSLIIDTADLDARRQFTGLYRIDLDGNEEIGASRLVREGIYRGPFHLSPDHSRLAIWPMIPSIRA